MIDDNNKEVELTANLVVLLNSLENRRCIYMFFNKECYPPETYEKTLDASTPAHEVLEVYDFLVNKKYISGKEFEIVVLPILSPEVKFILL